MDKEREIYIGENGLEHCSVCKEPIEEFFPDNVQKLFGRKKHQRFCACRRAEHEREECERKEREHQQEVEKNTAICFPERAIGIPKPNDYIKAKQKNGKPLYAEEIYNNTWGWLIECKCDHLLVPAIVEEYAMSFARWIQCEEAISE